MRNKHAGILIAAAVLVAAALPGCRNRSANGPTRASGYIEATEVRLAPEVGGRILEIESRRRRSREGRRPHRAPRHHRYRARDPTAEAERDQAVAQLRLLQAGSRVEDIRQAASQAQSADADVRAAEAELQNATADLDRFEALLKSNAGSRKQRDDAATRRDVAAARVQAARDHAQAFRENVAGLRAGARPDEIAAARARVSAVEAQIAALHKAIADAELKSPVAASSPRSWLMPAR